MYLYCSNASTSVKLLKKKRKEKIHSNTLYRFSLGYYSEIKN